MSWIKYSFLVLAFTLIFTTALAQTKYPQVNEWIPVIIENMQREKAEGYLRSDINEITVSTKDKQEKSIPLKLIESIKLEKIGSNLPGADQLSGEEHYSVRLQHSQEIFTLQKKFTFSLNTGVGITANTIDPNLFRKDLTPVPSSKTDQPFIRDKNVALNLEIKF